MPRLGSFVRRATFSSKGKGEHAAAGTFHDLQKAKVGGLGMVDVERSTEGTNMILTVFSIKTMVNLGLDAAEQ